MRKTTKLAILLAVLAALCASASSSTHSPRLTGSASGVSSTPFSARNA